MAIHTYICLNMFDHLYLPDIKGLKEETFFQFWDVLNMLLAVCGQNENTCLFIALWCDQITLLNNFYLYF